MTNTGSNVATKDNGVQRVKATNVKWLTSELPMRVEDTIVLNLKGW